jgi:hypothetical protein
MMPVLAAAASNGTGVLNVTPRRSTLPSGAGIRVISARTASARLGVFPPARRITRGGNPTAARRPCVARFMLVALS